MDISLSTGKRSIISVTIGISRQEQFEDILIYIEKQRDHPDCRSQPEDECRYHLRPPFDTRENENFAADSFPLFASLSPPFHKHAC